MSNPYVISAGEDCWIEARRCRDPRTGNLINVTGFGVHAVARALYERYVLGKPNHLLGYRYAMLAPVVAEWSTTPTGTQGDALTGTATTTSDPNTVQLHITPAQSSGWRCPLVIIQAELTDPVTQYVARIINRVYEIDFEAVR